MDGEPRLDDEEHPEGARGQAACHPLPPDLPGLGPVEDGVQAAHDHHHNRPEFRMYELFSRHAYPRLGCLLDPGGNKGTPLCTSSQDVSSRKLKELGRYQDLFGIKTKTPPIGDVFAWSG